eukprot:GEZU01004269.1.p2 GENE.GEZU01004269.1~~GEZU01004269.1.p2  ORF type:complete len:146 (+),score=39.90 GEZU01004269.1:289-726(+)
MMIDDGDDDDASSLLIESPSISFLQYNTISIILSVCSFDKWVQMQTEWKAIAASWKAKYEKEVRLTEQLMWRIMVLEDRLTELGYEIPTIPELDNALNTTVPSDDNNDVDPLSEGPEFHFAYNKGPEELLRRYNGSDSEDSHEFR